MTDTLPFEVPPTFSNRGFYSFLLKYSVELSETKLCWKVRLSGKTNDASEKTVRLIMQLLFGFDKSIEAMKECVKSGKKETWHFSIERKFLKKMKTIPFHFRISHKNDGRTLSIAHPRNQVWLAHFYSNYYASIVYYCSPSSFSIRHPVYVARKTYFDDKLHKSRTERKLKDIEEYDREYEQFGSYFVYHKYNSIYKFFESHPYQRCEKKYELMIQIDVGKCFDSIYTHAISWAALGKSQTKKDIPASGSSFSGKFDALMQYLNNQETNGIIIGPEFSRIFAEIIMQSVDVKIERNLRDRFDLTHKVDYEVFRYVDDFFIFLKDESLEEKVVDTVQEALGDVKLSINMSKKKSYSKPIITDLTIAKHKISTLLDAKIRPNVDSAQQERSSDSTHTDSDSTIAEEKFSCNEFRSRRLIVDYKQIVSESNVEYQSVLNYTFAIIEQKIDRIVELYSGLNPENIIANQEIVVKSIKSIIDFMFFIYFANPSVGLSVRACRMISTSVELLVKGEFSYDIQHFLYKAVYENVRLIIDKKTIGLHREVESSYLLTSLSSIGKAYRLPERMIAKHFLIEWNSETKQYFIKRDLSYFSITVLLSYMKNIKRYGKLRCFIECHAFNRIWKVRNQCNRDAEALMLFLDMIVCPYVSPEIIGELAKLFLLQPGELKKIQFANKYWFTAWDKKFDLSKALDLKRRREVY